MKLVSTGVSLNFLRMSAPHCLALPHGKFSGPVSSVHETRYQQLYKMLNELAGQLSGKRAVSPVETRDRIVRVLAVVALLLRQHHVNKWGQCKFCALPRWKWSLPRLTPFVPASCWLVPGTR